MAEIEKKRKAFIKTRRHPGPRSGIQTFIKILFTQSLLQINHSAKKHYSPSQTSTITSPFLVKNFYKNNFSQPKPLTLVTPIWHSKTIDLKME